MNIYALGEQSGEGVYIKVIIDGLEPLLFYRQGESALEMHLLMQRIESDLGTQMEQLRRVSYLRGWRDAKAKRKKDDRFVDCVALMSWEEKDAGL